MIWGILVGLAYLGVAVLAFREILALWVREFGKGNITDQTVWGSAILSLVWFFALPTAWVEYGGPTWYRPRVKTPRSWTGLENWATKKKED